MINRTLIRLKIVQLIYAFYQNGGKNIDMAEKELLFSLSKAYDLYNYMLLLIVSVSRYPFQDVEHQEQMNRVGDTSTRRSVIALPTTSSLPSLKKTSSCRSSLTRRRNLGTTTSTTSRSFTPTSSRASTTKSTWRWRRSLMPTTANCGARSIRTSS